MTELAEDILNDGQLFRPICNYLLEVYKDLEGKTTLFPEEITFTDDIQFYEYLKGAIDSVIQYSKEVKLDNEEV